MGASRPARSGGDLRRLYRDVIRQHTDQPVGFRQRIETTHRHEEFNPLCGDRIELELNVREGRIREAAFDGEACAICLASASILCQEIGGETPSTLRAWRDSLEAALQRDGRDPAVEALQPLMGVRPYPSRIRCATLPWTAAVKALDSPERD